MLLSYKMTGRPGPCRRGGLSTFLTLRSGCLFAWVVAGALLGSGCARTRPNFAPYLLPQPGAATNVTYVIQPGDVLSIKFAYDTNLDEQVVVRPDGKISLQLVDEIKAEGREPAELARELAQLYGRVLRDPKVAVIVREFAGMKVYVGGEVYSPRMLPLTGRMTALQAVQSAGGFNDKAKLSSVIIVSRGEGNLPSARTVNLKKVLAGDPYGEDPVLRPFDVVYVPKTFIASANKFVEQYIEEMIPGNLSSGFSYTIWRGTYIPP